MKIALVIERMDPSRGGRETSTAQVACELARRGHGVDVLCQGGSWRADGVTVAPLGRGLLPRWKLANFVAAVQEAAGSGRYDIVHATLPVPGANVYQPRGGTIPGRRAAGLRRHRLTGWMRSGFSRAFNLRRRLMARLERQVAGDSSVWCLAVSNMIAQEFRQHYRRTDRVRVIRNAVAVPQMSPEDRAHHRQRIRYSLGLSPKDVVFITVAKNFELKAIGQCIVAFARWYYRRRGDLDARLVVVGRDNPESYHRYAGLRDVGRQVVFVPPTPDIFEWYAAADACVLLSWYDPCSRVVLEAARWGIPSITTAYNGAAEVLAGGAGIVIDSPRNIKAVVESMDALSDPEVRAACSKACVQLAPGLSIERHVDELVRTYQEIARRP